MSNSSGANFVHWNKSYVLNWHYYHQCHILSRSAAAEIPEWSTL